MTSENAIIVFLHLHVDPAADGGGGEDGQLAEKSLYHAFRNRPTGWGGEGGEGSELPKIPFLLSPTSVAI